MVLFLNYEATTQEALAFNEVLLFLPLYDGYHIFHSSCRNQPK